MILSLGCPLSHSGSFIEKEFSLQSIILSACEQLPRHPQPVAAARLEPTRSGNLLTHVLTHAAELGLVYGKGVLEA